MLGRGGLRLGDGPGLDKGEVLWVDGRGLPGRDPPDLGNMEERSENYKAI